MSFTNAGEPAFLKELVIVFDEIEWKLTNHLNININRSLLS